MKRLAALLFCFALLVASAATVASDTPNLSVTSYVVIDAPGFPSLPLPQHALVFLNGLYQTPGIDYAVAGQAFRLKVVSVGDGVSVVALP